MQLRNVLLLLLALHLPPLLLPLILLLNLFPPQMSSARLQSVKDLAGRDKLQSACAITLADFYMGEARGIFNCQHP